MRSLYCWTVSLLTAMLGALAPNLMAQEVGHRVPSEAAYCEREATTLGENSGGEAYYRAVSSLPACGATGVRALRAQWRQLPGDTTALRLLSEVTPRLRDRRLLDAVLAVFRDRGRSREARFAALNALVGYYDSSLGVSFTEPVTPVQHGSAYVMVGVNHHPPTTNKGPTPLGVSVSREILQTLQHAGTHDPDERIRLISSYLHSRLSYRAPMPD